MLPARAAPPATSTRPSRSSAAACLSRAGRDARPGGPGAVRRVVDAGRWRSSKKPPTASTRPFGSSVAEESVVRASTWRSPVAANVPVAGLKSSAVARREPARDQHPAVRQQGRQVVVARPTRHRPRRRGPRLARRVVELGARELAAVEPPGDEHAAVGQQRRRVLPAAGREARGRAATSSSSGCSARRGAGSCCPTVWPPTTSTSPQGSSVAVCQ